MPDRARNQSRSKARDLGSELAAGKAIDNHLRHHAPDAGLQFRDRRIRNPVRSKLPVIHTFTSSVFSAGLTTQRRTRWPRLVRVLRPHYGLEQSAGRSGLQGAAGRRLKPVDLTPSTACRVSVTHSPADSVRPPSGS